MYNHNREQQLLTADQDIPDSTADPTLYYLATLNKPVSPILALTLIRQTAEALADAYRFGIVHKDLRPETIFIKSSDLPAVLNFDPPSQPEDGEEWETSYQSPEQKAGKALDGRSNIYTLGIIFYELLYGNRPEVNPLAGQDLDLTADNHPEISAQTLRVINNCWKEQSWARYQNYTELIKALDRALLTEAAASDGSMVPIPAAANPAKGMAMAKNIPAPKFRLAGRWLPVAATVLFLALLGMAMLNSWNQSNSSSSIRIFDQLPLLFGGEDNPARQTAVSQGATATIRALQIRLPTRTLAAPAIIESEPVGIEEPPRLPVFTQTPTSIAPTFTPTATSTNPPPPPPPPPPSPTPTETPSPTIPPTPTATSTNQPPPPPPPPPGPTNTPPSSPTSAPPEPTEPPPTPTPPPPPTPTPPVIPTSTVDPP